MNASELTGMDNAALEKKLDDLYQEIFNLRFQRAAGQLANYNRLEQVRRDIARVKTILHQRAKSGEVRAR
jgi:large subunit ribosomal protein L29